VQLPNAGPPARHSAGMAYDSQREVTVLFGGFAGNTRNAPMYGDTWEWDGVSWRLVATTGPSPRMGHSMVFDEARGVVVLFGGGGLDGFNSDTWEWDGREWKLVAQTGPSARSRAGMAYDKERNKVVLFGGIPRDTNDTWEWDGVKWTEIRTTQGPSGRSRVGMAFDAGRKKIILFGGRLQNGEPAGGTWEWDGKAWLKIAESAEHARARHGMVYDESARKLTTFAVG
jgi:hypothetical protein